MLSLILYRIQYAENSTTYNQFSTISGYTDQICKTAGQSSVTAALNIYTAARFRLIC